MSRDRHVVVVGAGVVGLCVADQLLRRGFQVTVLEREAKPGDGCSYGNGGIVVPSHFVPLAAPGMIGVGLRMLLDRRSPFGFTKFANLATASWIAQFVAASTKKHVERCGPVLRDLNLASRELYAELALSTGNKVGYEQQGLLMLSKTHAAHASEARLAESAHHLGLRAKEVGPQELAVLEPDAEVKVSGAVHFEDDAHLTPASVMESLTERIESRGGTICYGASVTSMEIENRRVNGVHTAGRFVEADEVVLAAGAWSGTLARSMGLRLPMLAGRGFGFTVASPPQRLRLPSILTEARVAVTPMLDGVRFVGTMELGANVVTPTSPRVEGMKRNIPGYYPAFSGVSLDAPVWCGLRPCSPDGMPYIGRTKMVQNLTIATGHAMMGMSLGPVTGQMVADLLTETPSSLFSELLSPDRYA